MRLPISINTNFTTYWHRFQVMADYILVKLSLDCSHYSDNPLFCLLAMKKIGLLFAI